MKFTLFWDVMPCSLVNSYQCFGGMCFRLEGCENLRSHMWTDAQELKVSFM
jgi:hypothetical protein